MDLDRIEETQDTGPDWSVSRLQTIYSCGKKYEYKYIEHVEEPPTVPLSFGSAVHFCLEHLHSENKWGDAYITRTWADVWYSMQIGIDWESIPNRKSTYDKKGLAILESYRDTNQNDEWYALESHFRFYPGDARPHLRGTFDKIVRLKTADNIVADFEYDGRLAVIDYKTSKNPPDKLLLRVDPQLTIYHRAAEALLEEDLLLGIHHLISNKIYLTKRTEKDMDAVLAMISEGLSRVEDKKFERNISWNCRYCPFKEICLGELVNGIT